MFKLSNETKIGILAVVAIAIGIFGFKYLQGINVLKTSTTFKVRYDNVDQLRPGAPVFISGLQVGMVKTLYVDPENGKSIIAELNIDHADQIPKDAVATIIGLTLMGGKAVRLDNTHPCEGDGCAEDGDFLKGDSKSFINTVIGDPAELDVYTDRLRVGLTTLYDSIADPKDPQGLGRSLVALEQSLLNIASMTNKINRLLDASANGISATAGNAAEITKNIRNSDADITKIIQNLSDISQQLKDAQLNNTTQKTNTALDSVTQSLSALRKTLVGTQHTLTQVDSLASNLVQGEGSAGKLLTDPELYDNLVRTSRHLQLLLQDVRLNPKRYNTVKLKVFGKNKTGNYQNPMEDPAYQLLIDSLEDDYSKRVKGN